MNSPTVKTAIAQAVVAVNDLTKTMAELAEQLHVYDHVSFEGPAELAGRWVNYDGNWACGRCGTAADISIDEDTAHETAYEKVLRFLSSPSFG